MTIRAGRKPRVEIPDDDSFVDGGYGWVIMVVCFSLCMISNGIAFSSGIFYIAIVDHFHGSSTDVAWIMSLLRFFFMLIGPLASIMLTKLGGRITILFGSLLISAGFLISAYAPVIGVLYFSMGFLTGSGLGMNYQAAVVIVNYYFLKRRGVANGIVGCGGGVGLFVFPLVINILLKECGFQGACMILAGIALQGLICGSLVIPPEVALKIKKRKIESQMLKQISTLSNLVRNTTQIVKVTARRKSVIPPHPYPLIRTPDRSCLYVSSIYSQRRFSVADGTPLTLSDNIKTVLKLSYDIKLVKNVYFLLFALSQIFYNYAFPTAFVFMPDRALSFGLHKEEGSFLPSMVGISSTISKLTCGLLADTKFVGKKRLYIYAGGMIVGGASIVVNFGQTFALQMLMATLLGVCGGSVYSLLCIVLADLLGVEKLTKAYGMISFASAFASLIGPALSGWVFDFTGRYDIVFVSLGTSLLVGGGVMFIIPCIRQAKAPPRVHYRLSRKERKMSKANLAFQPDSSISKIDE